MDANAIAGFGGDGGVILPAGVVRGAQGTRVLGHVQPPLLALHHLLLLLLPRRDRPPRQVITLQQINRTDRSVTLLTVAN